jgi:hypothetical protein
VTSIATGAAAGDARLQQALDLLKAATSKTRDPRSAREAYARAVAPDPDDTEACSGMAG